MAYFNTLLSKPACGRYVRVGDHSHEVVKLRFGNFEVLDSLAMLGRPSKEGEFDLLKKASVRMIFPVCV